MKMKPVGIILILFFLLCVTNCSGGGDSAAPSNMAITGLTTTESSITFTWSDPTYADFDHVAIACTDGSAIENADVAAGIKEFTLNEFNGVTLTTRAALTFTFSTVDADGKVLETKTHKAMTSPAGALTYTLVSTAEEHGPMRARPKSTAEEKTIATFTDTGRHPYRPDSGPGFFGDPNDGAVTDDIWSIDDSATDPINGGYPY